MNNNLQKWQHPGGKFRELGAETLTAAEFLACIISTGIPGKPGRRLLRKFCRGSAALRAWKANAESVS